MNIQMIAFTEKGYRLAEFLLTRCKNMKRKKVKKF